MHHEDEQYENSVYATQLSSVLITHPVQATKNTAVLSTLPLP